MLHYVECPFTAHRQEQYGQNKVDSE
jgi:hypothetical protein